MKCPDCQGNLLPVSVTGFDESFRCSACGGFWLAAWAVTKAAEEDIDQWTRLGLKADPTLATNKCPKDKTSLISGKSESLPDMITARKCPTCEFWWMPGDTLFDYRAAQAAKQNYLKWWGKPSDMLAAFLPALLVVMMAFGIAYGVGLLRKNTNLSVPARSPKMFFSTVYEGGGKAIVNIASQDSVSEVEVLKLGDEKGVVLQPEKTNEVYRINLEGLEEGKKYLIRVNGEVFEFVAE